MENKTFQIDSNIISNKKKSNKSVNKNSNNKKTKSKNNIPNSIEQELVLMKQIILRATCRL